MTGRADIRLAGPEGRGVDGAEIETDLAVDVDVDEDDADGERSVTVLVLRKSGGTGSAGLSAVVEIRTGCGIGEGCWKDLTVGNTDWSSHGVRIGPRSKGAMF